MSAQDREAWEAFVRGPRRAPAGGAPERAAEARPTAAPALASALAPLPPVPAPGLAPAGLDRGTWRRFSGGRVAVERTLDLHGRTAAAAHRALLGFLQDARADGVRCVEVITGKGSVAGGGVIRRELPHWLEEPTVRPMILAVAHPHAANPGAVRLLLRRNRR